MLKSPSELLRAGKPLTLAGVADGAEGLVIADLARAAQRKAAPSLLVVCRDGPRMAALARALAFFAPDISVIEFPAWDCQPYDRVSPHAAVVAERMAALSRLARHQIGETAVVLTTVNAALQRVPPRALIAAQSLAAAPGNVIRMDAIVQWLELNGFVRASTVREPGDYAVRGGILDLFAPGMDLPVRLDFFGDTLESIRSFDPETQRTAGQLRALNLMPVAEFQLTPETVSRFRQGYVAAFGAPQRDDLLYEAVSERRRHPGMEHWLPLFHERL
jgi:transcription-repair coupling factor (superfamily II helicase)